MVMGMIDELLGCWCFGYAPQRIYMKICVMNLVLIYRFQALVRLGSAPRSRVCHLT